MSRARPTAAATAPKKPAAARKTTSAARPARSDGGNFLRVLVSADGQQFAYVQAIGKQFGVRTGRVGRAGKATGQAFSTTTTTAARAAARAHVAALQADGWVPGDALTGRAD